MPQERREEHKQEKKGCLQIIQKIQSCGSTVNYYPTIDQARRHGTIAIPSATFIQAADPRKPDRPLEISAFALVENKRLARWLASKCTPINESDERKSGFVLDVREAMKSGFFSSEEELRAIMAGRIQVDPPIPPIPLFEMMTDERMRHWAMDNRVEGYDDRKARSERVMFLADWVKSKLEASK